MPEEQTNAVAAAGRLKKRRQAAALQKRFAQNADPEALTSEPISVIRVIRGLPHRRLGVDG
jgi:hypothetical protein